MDLQKIIAEIGLMEIGRIIARFTERGVVTPFLPIMMPDSMDRQIGCLAKEILALKKRNLFLMTPEIALLEILADNNWKDTVIIAIPRDADLESADRIQANIPKGINVQFLYEGEFPEDFIPENGAVLCAGFTIHGTEYKILPSSYRMMCLYKQFAGRRVFVSAFPSECDIPELGWINADADFFTSRVGIAAAREDDTDDADRYKSTSDSLIF